VDKFGFHEISSHYLADSKSPLWEHWGEVELFKALDRVDGTQDLGFLVDSSGMITIFKDHETQILSIKWENCVLQDGAVVEYIYSIREGNVTHELANLATVLNRVRLCLLPDSLQYHAGLKQDPLPPPTCIDAVVAFNLAMGGKVVRPVNSLFDRSWTFVEVDSTTWDRIVSVSFFGLLITENTPELSTLMRCWLTKFSGCLVFDFDNALSPSELFFGSLSRSTRERTDLALGRFYVVARPNSQVRESFSKHWERSFPMFHVSDDMAEVLAGGQPFFHSVR